MFQKSIEINESKLQTMKSSRSNRLRRFGEHMPALLTAIQEAHKRGQFKHRPRGPLGKTSYLVFDSCFEKWNPDKSVVMFFSLHSFMNW